MNDIHEYDAVGNPYSIYTYPYIYTVGITVKVEEILNRTYLISEPEPAIALAKGLIELTQITPDSPRMSRAARRRTIRFAYKDTIVLLSRHANREHTIAALSRRNTISGETTSDTLIFTTEQSTTLARALLTTVTTPNENETAP